MATYFSEIAIKHNELHTYPSHYHAKNAENIIYKKWGASLEKVENHRDLELKRKIEKGLRFHVTPLFYLVGSAGIEPATNGLKVHCSTI